MMLGISSPSSFIPNSSDTAAAVAAGDEAHNHDSTGGGSGEFGGAGTNPAGGGFSDEDKGRIEFSDSGGGGGGGGNRWPRQETLDLLRIRSEMEVAFRDSNLKGPLWEEVSRKMSQLGYKRSGKKCKEKFENVYKYHKRTKDGRASKSDGKTYRFFEQLEALEKNPSSFPSLQPPPPPRTPQPQPQHVAQAQPLAQAQAQSQAQTPMPAATTTAVAVVVPMALATTNNPPISTHVTVSSAPAAIPVSFSPSMSNNPLFSTLSSTQLPPATSSNPPQGNHTFQSSHPHMSLSLPSDFTSSSTSSDEDIRRRHKRKRKLKDFFEGLMKDMMEKQEDLHKKFLETLEKRERDRMIREEAWRVQEMARMNRELDLLTQERSMAAAKDAAVMAFLQKFTGQQMQNPHIPNVTIENHAPKIQSPLPQLPQNSHRLPQPPPPPPPPAPAPPAIPISTTSLVTSTSPAPAPPAPAEAYALTLSTNKVEITRKNDNVSSENFMTPSSSRWPKAEVEALINLRTNLDMKYQDNGPKGPLWEEISSQMSKLGYNRNAKRCKEKWENINKYFKKVKESNKKRHEDSKTCPYFHQLEALYNKKAKTDPNPFQISYPNPTKPENPVPIMARPEQQWPIPQQENAHMDEEDDHESENYEDNEDEDEDEEEGGGGYEIVTNKRQVPVSVATTTAA